MGRALFSLSYAAPEPAVRTEPEPKVDTLERWSAWNRFDPDSDEFFRDAQLEAFIDPEQAQREQTQMAALAAAASEGSTDSSDSGDSSDSDQGSPMVVGSNDPPVRISGPFSNRPRTWDGAAWADRSISPASYDSSSTASPALSANSPQSPDELGNPPFIPPSAFREPSPIIEGPALRRAASPRMLRRSVNITPITISHIQVEPATRSPSPDSSEMPSTPPAQIASYRQQAHAMVSPSPPPTVSPRFYSWQHHPLPALPSSPTSIRGNRDGPLTNPRARMSFARIEATPARVRISNTVM